MKKPPMLPVRRARFATLCQSVHDALWLVYPRGRHIPPAGGVDTQAIDAGWSEGPIPERLSPFEMLACMVRSRGTGRAIAAQANARSAVVDTMTRCDVRRLRFGDITFVLRADRIMGQGDVLTLRAGGLYVKLAKDRSPAQHPLPLAPLASVIDLAERRASLAVRAANLDVRTEPLSGETVERIQRGIEKFMSMRGGS